MDIWKLILTQASASYTAIAPEVEVSNLVSQTAITRIKIVFQLRATRLKFHVRAIGTNDQSAE
jgi:hypothetical protein